MGRNFHVRRSGRIQKSTHRYDRCFESTREWKNDDVANIVYMIQDGSFNSNTYVDEILSLMNEWYVEDYMDIQSTFHTRSSYILKSQSHNPDTPMYMEALSGENAEEISKAMASDIQSLLRRYK